MRAPALYRIAAVILLLFAAGHSFGFLQSDPQWGVGALLDPMRSIHFHVQGFNRSYWDFFAGFGWFVSVFLVFSAVLAWQLGGLRAESLAQMRVVAWAFAICFLTVTALAWSFFFAAPVIFSALISVCLARAAVISGKPIPKPSEK